jgi:23S rRNA pseudouridine1911/1915/1917 synthase
VNDRLETFHFKNDQLQRLDKFLVGCLPEYSRSRLQGLIKDGYVLVDGDIAYKTGQKLDEGCVVEVRVPPPQPSTLTPESIALDIIYEDDNVIVVNKPAGMVVHPAAGHPSGTLVHAALAHAPAIEGIGGERRPGVVHRLDKDTSGVIILAKNDTSHRWLQDQFRSRKVEKTYLALVDDKPPTPRGRIEAPIGRDPHHRKHMAIVVPDKGRQAISEYNTLESFPKHTLLEVHPITGRTHQIRLHMDFLGCPIVGDTTYGRQKSSLPLMRHFLHASRIRIALAEDSAIHTFEAPLPAELVSLLVDLRASR